MDFGLFYEIQVPRPWHERSEYQALKNVIAQVVQAEQSGFTHFWTVEHHFLAEWSHCSAPEVLYGAISQRTEKIKIGHAVRLLPFPYNHPIRVAETAATLDLISDGRLQFGTGRSITLDEMLGFGIDPAQTRELWEEALDIVIGAWTNEIFQWEGKHFKIPPRHVIPKPLQKPHPPLWVSCTGPETHEIAGRKGMGLLSFILLAGPDELADRIKLYRRGLSECKPVGKAINAQAAAHKLTFCAPTNAEARRVAEEAVMWYVRSAAAGFADLMKGLCHNNPSPEVPVPLGDSYAYLKGGAFDERKMNFDYLLESDAIIVGDPDTCVQKIKKYRQAGLDQLLLMTQMYNIPHEQIMQSIRLFGEYVIPAVP
jgi:alkanesulfonate monooxygenase SsuD/methylene tetrahydromethanopterin reductase-like flavin-dependent oxidoreductase (luciferase family)